MGVDLSTRPPSRYARSWPRLGGDSLQLVVNPQGLKECAPRARGLIRSWELRALVAGRDMADARARYCGTCRPDPCVTPSGRIQRTGECARWKRDSERAWLLAGEACTAARRRN